MATLNNQMPHFNNDPDFHLENAILHGYKVLT